jgi:hypothetical protein
MGISRNEMRAEINTLREENRALKTGLRLASKALESEDGAKEEVIFGLL